MRLGQTSVIVFASKLVGSALGFVSTIYFARVLGAEVIGIYALVIAILSWLKVGGRVGINRAIIKRISEGREQGQFLAAGFLLILSLLVILIIALLFFRSNVENYVSGFEEYSSVSVVWFLVAILSVYMITIPVKSTLHGQRLVHIVGILNPLKITTQSLIQILLVFFGFGLVGMLVGYGAGVVIITAIGLFFVSVRPQWPERRHFRSLLEYAKFSWLSGLKSRTLNDVDILLLGVFVQTALVGVYSIAWSLATFLNLFGNAISSTMFPEISQSSAQESKEAVSGLIEDSLAFAGLIAIPGFVGSTVLAERLLQIYGPEFTRGSSVLALLVLAILLNSYQNQLLNALNGIDRPDLAFRINAVFIALNAGLNVVLIWLFGIKGAAIASVVSVAVATLLAYRNLEQLVEFRMPFDEIARQALAALLMGIIVFGALETIETAGLLQHNFALVLLLVTTGASIYFLTLLAISSRFRTTVDRNVPFDVPYLN